MSAPGTDTANYTPPDGDGIAVVTLDHFPVNSLSRNVTNGCTLAILEIEKDPNVKGVVVHGAGRCFCAGADISEFGADGGPEVVDLGRAKTDMLGFEGLEVPVVAAIHGYALGGGLEAALGCHYRVIDEDSAVGLPEVNIGLLPGGQGTQRLPRLIGCEAALELMTSGDHVPAPQALEWQVVDQIVTAGSDMVTAAKEFCKTKIGQPTPKIVAMPPPAPNADFGAWETNMAKARPGEIAPQAIIRCVQGAVAGPTFKDGDKVEKSEFAVLVKSPESNALRHMFFAERAGAKVDGLKVKPTPIQKVGIVGAGLMGGGIGMSCAEAGLDVIMLDINEEGIARNSLVYCRATAVLTTFFAFAGLPWLRPEEGPRADSVKLQSLSPAHR